MVVVLVVLTFAAVFAIEGYRNHKKAAAENIVLDHGGLGLTMADGKPEEKKNEK
ncbi:MAG: hypothetical protein LC102_10845 [Ignavibacteriales bacterium]|jgi:hypothetical protein|nr:hypothetical protein [Ignavibacteriaceae bacterium]MBW7873687.1 hypothetical protein [Ignavibacteria bacterium]MBZ0197541.1 hypothetical protein [Ignavibacteriaceae bacterium]MCZ2143912.1 hypothetical protein [Ignavibacteriales bacterium]WKZ71961.1 MAG: hypothetical protein QY308_10060 [Ignavibacteriaceae bacterium]